jgi:ElaB/YqjD/DUF883 family membrane-anchored ribosome-binding protein
MAQTERAQTERAAQATGKKPRRGRSTKSSGEANRRRSNANQISELEQVIRGLEQRLSGIGGGREGIRSAVTGASNQMGEAVADTLSDVMDRLLNRAFSVTQTARIGTGLLGRVTTEVEKRPFMTVAIALGIGFLAGMAGRAAETPNRRR